MSKESEINPFDHPDDMEKKSKEKKESPISDPEKKFVKRFRSVYESNVIPLVFAAANDLPDETA